jgi:hypothetical protein
MDFCIIDCVHASSFKLQVTGNDHITTIILAREKSKVKKKRELTTKEHEGKQKAKMRRKKLITES